MMKKGLYSIVYNTVVEDFGNDSNATFWGRVYCIINFYVTLDVDGLICIYSICLNKIQFWG